MDTVDEIKDPSNAASYRASADCAGFEGVYSQTTALIYITKNF